MSGLFWKECDGNWDKMLQMPVCWLEDGQRAETFCAEKQYIELASLKVSFRQIN